MGAYRAHFATTAHYSPLNVGHCEIIFLVIEAADANFFPAKHQTRPTCHHGPCETKPQWGEAYCSRHRRQFEKYGITWDDRYPKEKMAEWRKANAKPCAVRSCGEIAVSKSSGLCKNHRGDKIRKDCSLEFYLRLLNTDACEICGETGYRLVTDHDHRHPHKRDAMCEQCIRGRLCNSCNSALGYLKDDPKRMYALAAYAARHANKF